MENIIRPVYILSVPEKNTHAIFLVLISVRQREVGCISFECGHVQQHSVSLTETGWQPRAHPPWRAVISDKVGWIIAELPANSGLSGVAVGHIGRALINTVSQHVHHRSCWLSGRESLVLEWKTCHKPMCIWLTTWFLMMSECLFKTLYTIYCIFECRTLIMQFSTCPHTKSYIS